VRPHCGPVPRPRGRDARGRRGERGGAGHPDDRRAPAGGGLVTRASGPLAALLTAMAVGSVLVLAYGQAPAHVWLLLCGGTWGVSYGIGQVLYKATPLMLTGLAVALGLRAGLFNIGAEGQLTLGALAAAVVGAHMGGVAAGLALPLVIVAAALAGAAW